MAVLDHPPLAELAQLGKVGTFRVLPGWLVRLRAILLALAEGTGFSLGASLRAVITDATGALSTSPTTSTELAYLQGVTSSVQTQINGKVSKAGDTIGDFAGGDYTHIEADGTIKFNGAATVFNDLQFSISSGKVSAVNAPTWSTFKNNLSEYTFAVNDFIDCGAQEIPHSYKSGSDMDIHVHWSNNGVDGTDRAVKWEIEYTIANYTTPTPTAFPTTTVVSAETTIPAGTTSISHFKTFVGTISGTGLTYGASIKLRLRRIASAGTAPASDPFALQVGIHVEEDTIGSRTATSK